MYAPEDVNEADLDVELVGLGELGNQYSADVAAQVLEDGVALDPLDGDESLPFERSPANRRLRKILLGDGIPDL